MDLDAADTEGTGVFQQHLAVAQHFQSSSIAPGTAPLPDSPQLGIPQHQRIGQLIAADGQGNLAGGYGHGADIAFQADGDAIIHLLRLVAVKGVGGVQNSFGIILTQVIRHMGIAIEADGIVGLHDDIVPDAQGVDIPGNEGIGMLVSTLHLIVDHEEETLVFMAGQDLLLQGSPDLDHQQIILFLQNAAHVKGEGVIVALVAAQVLLVKPHIGKIIHALEGQSGAIAAAGHIKHIAVPPGSGVELPQGKIIIRVLGQSQLQVLQAVDGLPGGNGLHIGGAELGIVVAALEKLEFFAELVDVLHHAPAFFQFNDHSGSPLFTTSAAAAAPRRAPQGRLPGREYTCRLP